MSVASGSPCMSPWGHVYGCGRFQSTQAQASLAVISCPLMNRGYAVQSTTNAPGRTLSSCGTYGLRRMMSESTINMYGSSGSANCSAQLGQALFAVGMQ